MSEKKISYRLFMGFLMTHDLRNRLKENPEWKNLRFHHPDLMQISFQGKEYLGQFIPPALNLHELKQIELTIRNKLEAFHPELTSLKIKTVIFPQVFIS